MNLSGPIFLLLSPSEVILSGGPWRSSIIPYLPKFGKPFLHLFCLFDLLYSFVAEITPSFDRLPLCIFFPIYNVLYSADRYSFCRILHHGEGLNCQADFVLKKAPVFCQKHQNTKSCGHSLDLSLNSDIMKSLFRILRRAVAHTKVCSRLYQNRTDTADQMEEFL